MAATDTEAGAVRAAPALLVSVTVAPGASGALDRVTVQVALPFDVSTVAVQVSPVMVGGVCSEMVVLAVPPFKLPVNVAVWFADTVPVEILNVPVVAFAGSKTDAGADKAGEALLVRFTVNPEDGAAFETVTVQVALPFELRAGAVQVSAVIVAGGCRVILNIAAVPFNAAVRVAV